MRKLPNSSGSVLVHHASLDKSVNPKLLESLMHIPPLHTRGQWVLRPLLCHRPVPFALILTQGFLDLATGFGVVLNKLRRSRQRIRKLKCQLVYLFAVHGSHNVKVRPPSPFIIGLL